MSSEPITFYDLTLRNGIIGSPNAWKTRYTLNYKGLPYKSTFLNFIDIKPTLKALDVPPLEGDFYTVPSIIDPKTGRRISDSLRIAEYLDTQYPDTPQLLPPGTREAQEAFEKNVRQPFAFTVFPLILLDFFNTIIDEKDQAYFKTSREAQFGAPFEAVVPTGDARAAQLEVVRAGVENVHREIEKHAGEGKIFFGGDRPVFADFQLAATFKSFLMGFGKEYEVNKLILSNEWAAKFIGAFEQWASTEQ
ncbi:unnamed protein product [Peniophora sp. CBMAI 1063]|nr:unnamed protein product [Peniophora sp. CBMAI 1063]